MHNLEEVFEVKILLPFYIFIPVFSFELYSKKNFKTFKSNRLEKIR